jgi:hypothetical protein
MIPIEIFYIYLYHKTINKKNKLWTRKNIYQKTEKAS